MKMLPLQEVVHMMAFIATSMKSLLKQNLMEYSDLYFYNVLEFKPYGIGSRMKDLVSFHMFLSSPSACGHGELLRTQIGRHFFSFGLSMSLWAKNTTIESASYSGM